MSRRTDLAYCAGVIDSDGTIGIKCNSYAMRVTGDCAQVSYSARICVRQVTTEAVEKLAAVLGGNVRPAKTYAKRGRLMHQWEIRDRKAEAALRAILPFLRIKKQQALNCLALRTVIARSKKVRVAKGRGHIGAGRRPAAIGIEMAALYARAKELNTVGIR